MNTFPRFMIAGLAGDSGKSLVSIGLARACRRQGRRVSGFKKGPDFIDAAWLGAATGSPGRNLDSFMMPAAAILRSLADASKAHDLAIVEGNRGLFDGLDVQGTHSSAALAKLIGAPVVLVLDASKATRTLAAYVLGCRAMDPDLPIAGVILNRVATARQERLVRQVLDNVARIPVLGAIPRLQEDVLPSRQLGLVTPVEHPDRESVIERLADLMLRFVDLPTLLRVAGSAPPVSIEPVRTVRSDPRVRVAILRDQAFSFYYPENLIALEEAGATLVPLSPLNDEAMPDVDALYGGGGFPERYAAQLAANESLRAALAETIADGLPVWAECGALMYLSRAIVCDGTAYPMVGAVPVTVEQSARPKGHGYVEAEVDSENPFLARGLHIRGHEFHYSAVTEDSSQFRTTLALTRGTGLGGRRDGLLAKDVFASYTHIHALGVPSWAPSLVRAALQR